MCKKTFIAKDGETYEIDIENDEEIIVRLKGVSMGSISLTYKQDDFSDTEYYYITHLALDACKRKGIGRACLLYHLECYGYVLTASVLFAGIENEDGSHLTGDGVPFISKMRDEGIVEPSPEDY